MNDRIPFVSMCAGPQPDRASQHKEKAEFHEMMATFYGLTEGQQKTFMVYFQSMLEENAKS